MDPLRGNGGFAPHHMWAFDPERFKTMTPDELLGSVPWAVEALADSGVISARTRAERINMARAGLEAFLSARGPCPTCKGKGYVQDVVAEIDFAGFDRKPCLDCLGSPGSGPSIAEKLT
jgi:hypothetical protein